MMRLAPLLLLTACSLEVHGTQGAVTIMEGQAIPDATPLDEPEAGVSAPPLCTGFDADASCTENEALDAGAEVPCPSNPEKTNPGVCGCGTPDADSDGDGITDCIDACIGFSNDSKEQGCTCDPAREACGNRPPTVTFVEPNTDTVQRDGLSIRADAHDEDGTIRRVTLFIDGKRIRDEREEPYRWGAGSGTPKELLRLSDGAHMIEVEAEDDQGATARVQRMLTILP